MILPDPAPVILLAHGSPDPRHRTGVEELAASVRGLTDAAVRIAYLDHHSPTAAEAAAGLTGGTLVPVLLTRAYHARTDVPEALATMGDGFAAAQPLGPDPRLAYAVGELLRRADQAPDPDVAVIVYVPGSSDRPAVAAVGEALAAGIPGEAWGPWLVAALDGGDPLPAVLAKLGHRRAVVVPYMVAEGVLRDRMVDRCRDAGVRVVGGTLGQTRMLAEIVLDRVSDARSPD